jgi:hypothetical protein
MSHNLIKIDGCTISVCIKDTYGGDCCPICIKPLNKETGITFNCNHPTCIDCCVGLIQSNNNSIRNTTCPICRQTINHLVIHNDDYDDNMNRLHNATIKQFVKKTRTIVFHNMNAIYNDINNDRRRLNPLLMEPY